MHRTLRLGRLSIREAAVGLALAATLGCHPPVVTVRTVALWDGPVSLPMIDGLVVDNPVPLVLDTGAERHFIVDAVAWGFGVETQGIGGTGQDGVGGTVGVDLAVDGALRIPGLPDDRLDALAVVYASTMRHGGFWGGLSPQRLVRSGERVLIDFRAGRMTVLPEDEERLTATGAPAAAATIQSCRLGDVEEERGNALLIQATIDGRTTQLFADTGASRTLLYDDTAAGRALAARVRPEDVPELTDGEPGEDPAPGATLRAVPERHVWIGGTADTLAVQDVPVVVGGWEGTTTVLLVNREEAEDCTGEGVLGFDVLQRCVLSIGTDIGELRCSDGPLPTPVPAESVGGGPVRLMAVDAAAGCGWTADELRPEVTGGELPTTFPSLPAAFGRLYEDVEARAVWIEEQCEVNGYLLAHVRRPPLVRAGDELRVWLQVDEGPRFRVRTVTIEIIDADGESVRRVDPAELPWWRSRPGEWYSSNDWYQDRDASWEAPELAPGAVEQLVTWETPDEATAEVDLSLSLVLER